MRKKLISVILAIAMLACVIPLGTMTAFAEDVDLGEITGEYFGPFIQITCSDAMFSPEMEMDSYICYAGSEFPLHGMLMIRHNSIEFEPMDMLEDGDYELHLNGFCEFPEIFLDDYVIAFSIDGDNVEISEIGGGTPVPEFTSCENGVMTFTVPKCTKVEKTGDIKVSYNGGTGVTAGASFCTITGNVLKFTVKNGDSTVAGINDKAGKYTITIPKVTYTTDKGKTVDAENVEFTYYICSDYSVAQYPFFQGSGTDADPYLIDAWYLLDYLADLVNAGNSSFNAASYKLTADIGGMTKSIGSIINNGFGGHFDGNGYTVTLNINIKNKNDYYFGLFGCLRSEGIIKNVTTAGSVKIVEETDYIGGVCGINYGGTIINCCNTANISGYHDVSGVCGGNYGTIINCYNTGDITGNEFVGGVCGSLGHVGIITNCYSAGNVSGNEYVGCVCGWISYGNGIIDSCYYERSFEDYEIYGYKDGESSVVDNCYGLPSEQMKAASGSTLNTGIADNKPLVDLLNDYVNNDESGDLKAWSNSNGKYPALHTHSFGDPDYFWNDDFSVCMAVRSCTGCDYCESETVSTANSGNTYTAEFTNEAFETQEKTVTDPLFDAKNAMKDEIDNAASGASVAIVEYAEEAKANIDACEDITALVTVYTAELNTINGMKTDEAIEAAINELEALDIISSKAKSIVKSVKPLLAKASSPAEVDVILTKAKGGIDAAEEKVTDTDRYIAKKLTPETDNMMGHQYKVGSTEIGRTIICLSEDDLAKITADHITVVGGDFEKETTFTLDCAYTYFYAGDTKYTAEGMGYAAFLIIDHDAGNEAISGFGYYRVYNGDDKTPDNFILDALFVNE